MFDCSMMPAPVENTNQEELALALRSRDIACIRALVAQYQHRLVRYLIYLLGRREGVDDLVQETWLRVLERGASFDGHSRFEPWLFAIARHLAIDELRKRKTWSLDSNAGEELTPQPAAPEAASPFVLAARSQDAERLGNSLQTLDPVYREALVLRFQEDLSLREISAVVGAPVSTVAARIYRGLAALRKQFGETHHAL